MKIDLTILISAVWILGRGMALPVCEAGEKPTAAEIRETVAKSLPFIAEKGRSWIEDRKCVSCHRVSFTTWSLDSARKHGFNVHPKLDDWLDWSLNHQLGENDKGGTVGSTNLDGLSQLLLGRDVSESAKEKDHDSSYAKFVEMIAKGQEKDGTWKPAGQLPRQKRPLAETTAVSTMWNTLALGTATGEAADSSRDKALRWIKQAQPGESNEWYVARLLIEQRFGTAEETERRLKELTQRQNPDGGWSWKIGDPSDALATGQTLYALQKAGLASDSPVLTRGERFLIDTQRKDGSWSVPGTKSKKNQPAETSTYWGTCWAVIGLLETLPASP